MKEIVVTTKNKATVREFTAPLFESVGTAVGDIVIMREGWTDEGPDIVGLSDDDVGSIITLLSKQHILTVEGAAL